MKLMKFDTHRRINQNNKVMKDYEYEAIIAKLEKELEQKTKDFNFLVKELCELSDNYKQLIENNHD